MLCFYDFLAPLLCASLYISMTNIGERFCTLALYTKLYINVNFCSELIPPFGNFLLIVVGQYLWSVFRGMCM